MSFAVLEIENVDICCFIWSFIAHLHPIADSKFGRSTSVSRYGQSFDAINIQGFHFSHGPKSNDVQIFEKINIFSVNTGDLKH